MGKSGPGVRVVFDVAIDEGAWPGPGAGGPSAFGELWLGPRGLLAFLEDGLGLGGKFVTNLERTLALSKLLEERDGFWAESFVTDTIATSERLLSDRDLLVLHGWRGQQLSPRLTELWNATAGAPMGMADRMVAVLETLSTRRVALESVRLHLDRGSLEPLWGSILDALDEQGVPVGLRPLPFAKQHSDLLSAQSSGFKPTGDGTLALLRPYGQLAAAEEIAASLAQMKSLDGVVIVGGDSSLDDALERHGLPRLGLRGASPASSVLVQLVLEAAFAPMDPASLHTLLALDPGPIPRPVAGRLIGAVCSIPGRYGPEWDSGLAAGIERIAEGNRAKVTDRIEALLLQVVKRDEELSQEELNKRLQHLCTWAGGRLTEHTEFVGIISHCQRIQWHAQQSGKSSFLAAELKAICLSTAESGGRTEALAGLTAVANPAAILRPARVIVWWDFSRASVRRKNHFRMSESEQHAFREAGLRAPEFADAMTREAELWQRPLRMASEALILVCPEVDEGGGSNYPHPLWDELCSAMSESHLASRLVVTELCRPASAVRRRSSLAPLPRAEDEIRITSGLSVRKVESPSSLSNLLGCSLKWALRHHGRLYSGLSHGPGDPNPRLFGTISHYILAEVFKKGSLDAATAAELAEKLSDELLTRMCESLGLPRYQEDLATVRRAVVESARQLGQILSESGAQVRGVELDVEGEFSDIAISGRADMILKDPDVVVDLKWAKATYYEKLETGTALQLAAYAHSAAQDDVIPSVAYFSLRDQLLMVEADSPFADAMRPGAVKATETWRLALEALARRKTQLADGQLVAPGATGEEVKSAVTSEGLTMSPDCKYCSFDTLCGRGAGQ